MTEMMTRPLPLEEFRAMMCTFPTGVAVVTTFDRSGAPCGTTCSSVVSVTLQPPTLLVCLKDGSPTLDAVLSTGIFTVNLLHGQARRTAETFAAAGDRFARVSWAYIGADGGPHLVGDAHAIADCRLVRAERVGDHTVLFGEVSRITERPGPPPLLYGLRRYGSWPADAPPAP